MPKVYKSKVPALISKLREYYIDDEPSQRLLDEKEEELRNALAAKQVQDMPAIQALIKSAQENVEAINVILQNDKELKSDERRALMGERDAHEFYIDRLNAEESDKKVKALEEYLEKKVEKIK